MNKQNEATWLKILEKKENHYKLREKLVIKEVKKEIIEKIEKIDVPYGCLQVKEQLQSIINLLTLNKYE